MEENIDDGSFKEAVEVLEAAGYGVVKTPLLELLVGEEYELE